MRKKRLESVIMLVIHIAHNPQKQFGKSTERYMFLTQQPKILLSSNRFIFVSIDSSYAVAKLSTINHLVGFLCRNHVTLYWVL